LEYIMKLYLVKCRGMNISVTGPTHGVAYVIANNPAEAYEKLRKDLDERDLGFTDERELSSIELIAEDTNYPSCGVRVYI